MAMFSSNCKIRWLYILCFGLANGVVAWSAILMRNSLLFHNLNTASSLYLHASCIVLMNNLHWRVSYSLNPDIELYDHKSDSISIGFFLYYIGLLNLSYIVWAVPYYILLFIIKEEEITREKYWTLYRLSEEAYPKLAKFYKRYGDRYKYLIFLGCHYCFFLMATIFSFICYFSPYPSIVAVGIITVNSIKRGIIGYYRLWKPYYRHWLKSKSN